MIVRKDAHGLYIRSRWYSVDKTSPPYRSGVFPGHTHARNTSHGGLQAGDKVKARHLPGEPFVRIRLADGRDLFWGSHGRKEGDVSETPREGG